MTGFAQPAMPSAPPGVDAPCIIDIEASGFGRDSYPIEVGWVLPDGRAQCTLIRCPPDWTHWDPAAERVHGLSRSQLRAHGREPLEVAQAMNRELAGQTVYCDGWAHDYPWLARLFDAADMSPRFRLQHVRALLDEAQAAALHGMRQRVRSELHIGRHRASSDARVLQQAVMRLRAGG